MRYFKSFVAGLIAAIVVMILSPLIMIPLGGVLFRNQLKDGESLGWDPVAMMRSSWIPRAVLLAAFSLGFYLQLRRSHFAGSRASGERD